MTIKPCECPLCRTAMRNLPHGSRTWHCTECGETMTEGYVQLLARAPALRELARARQALEVDRV